MATHFVCYERSFNHSGTSTEISVLPRASNDVSRPFGQISGKSGHLTSRAYTGATPQPGRSLKYNIPFSTTSPVRRRDPVLSKAYSSDFTVCGYTTAACRLAAVEIGPDGL